MCPHKSQHPSLVARLMEVHGEKMFADCESADERRELYDVLRKMGVNSDTLYGLGFEEEVADESPAAARDLRLSTLPPAGHLPFNSPVVRDWFFGPRATAVAPESVLVHGEGPFSREDLARFLETRGISDLSGIPLDDWSGRIRPCFVLVLGRSGWNEEVIDTLIEVFVNRQVRIYSQEMFLASLSSGRDPFYGGPDLLAAFRVGHPALEFVSEGWSGWVSTYVSAAWRHTAFDASGFGKVEIGPLRAMGYRVGRNGEVEEVRREILTRAFQGVLPVMGDEQHGGNQKARTGSTRLQIPLRHSPGTGRTTRTWSRQ